MGERCALNAPGQASGSGLESSPSPSHGSTGTGTSQSLGPSDRELIEEARGAIPCLTGHGYYGRAKAVTALADRLEALASRPAVAEGWVLVGSVVSAYGDPEAFGERRAEITADLMKLPYDTPLYALLSAALKP